jgi:hypothetical protein
MRLSFVRTIDSFLYLLLDGRIEDVPLPPNLNHSSDLVLDIGRRAFVCRFGRFGKDGFKGSLELLLLCVISVPTVSFNYPEARAIPLTICEIDHDQLFVG